LLPHGVSVVVWKQTRSKQVQLARLAASGLSQGEWIVSTATQLTWNVLVPAKPHYQAKPALAASPYAIVSSFSLHLSSLKPAAGSLLLDRVCALMVLGSSSWLWKSSASEQQID
jgi:hypothetical protein